MAFVLASKNKLPAFDINLPQSISRTPGLIILKKVPEENLNVGVSRPSVTPSPTAKCLNKKRANPTTRTCPGVSLQATELSLEQFIMHRKLGKGGFGIVYHAVDRLSGRDYALKVVDKSNVRAHHVCLILREQAAHRTLSSTGSRAFLSLHATWHDTANFYILTELQPRGDLRTDMRRIRIYDSAQAAYLVAELLLCLEDLHSRRMMHRDLKPDNILIDADGHLLLADFGMAKMFAASDSDFDGDIDGGADEVTLGAVCDDETDILRDFTRLPCGTPRYMAPEVLEGKWYTYSADVWSTGVILHTLLTGRPPYKAAKNDRKEQLNVVRANELDFAQDSLDPISQDILHGLLNKDPFDRLTIAEAKRHAFFAEIDWSLLEQRRVPPPKPFGPTPPTLPGPRDQLFVAPGDAYSTTNDTDVDREDPYPAFTYRSPAFRSARALLCPPVPFSPAPSAHHLRVPAPIGVPGSGLAPTSLTPTHSQAFPKSKRILRKLFGIEKENEGEIAGARGGAQAGMEESRGVKAPPAGEAKGGRTMRTAKVRFAVAPRRGDAQLVFGLAGANR